MLFNQNNMDEAVELLYSFDHFEAFFFHTKQNAIVLMGADGIVTAVNTAFTLSYGYENKDIAGKYMGILYTEEDRLQKLPENELRTVLTEGRSSDNNYLVSKDGTITWVTGESIRVSNKKGEYSIFKVIQNIHAIKVSEAELRILNDLNENILGSIEDVVVVLNDDLDIIKVNYAFHRLFTKKETGFPHANFIEFVKSYDINNQLLAMAQNTINSGKSGLIKDIELSTSKNEKRIFDVRCRPIQQSSKKSVLLILSDITVHKQIEREREDIIGFVAHELRNPLANVVLCNEIMSDAIQENDLAEIEGLLQRSKSNVMRLHKMIGELYDATKAKSGNLQLEISTFNFRDMIKEAVDTVQALQPAYNIIIEGNGDVEVQGDKYRLIQVVTNYLSNGIKYSNGKTDVTVSVRQSGESIIVSVRDEGMGIPAKQLPYIFDRFFRAEKTRNIDGVGLGLYLCSQIIHAHKGQVWAESEEGKGSTFYFSIPVLH